MYRFFGYGNAPLSLSKGGPGKLKIPGSSFIIIPTYLSSVKLRRDFSPDLCRKFRKMSWILLIIAGLFEVGFTTCLSKAKETSGNVSLMWMAGFFFSLVASMYLLYRATLQLPMGTAYAVWTGIGAVGTVIFGIVYFREPADFWRIFFLFLLIGSIVGLKMVTKH